MLGNGWTICNKKTLNYLIIKGLVRIIGLEPTRLAAPDPKSGMSTNFTISAKNTSLNIYF
jgi:hypothetical protein